MLGIVPVSLLLDDHLQFQEPTEHWSDNRKQHNRVTVVASFQLTVLEAPSAGPRCSESCRSVDCRTSACNPKNQQSTGQTTANNTNAPPSSPRSNSQSSKRRQLAHGARNRAGQLIVVQVPAIPRTNRALVRQSANNRQRIIQRNNVAPRTL